MSPLSPRAALSRFARDERGQAAAELVGMLWWLLLCAVVVWQLMLAAWAANQAANAARTASRVAAREGDARKAAGNALSPGLRDGMRVTVEGERAEVSVRIPIIVPGITNQRFTATRAATLPG